MRAPAEPAPGLLLHLSAPLQAYGTGSRFASIRDTATHPTRSALIGMIAASLGIPRTRPELLKTLRPLRFTIRVDRPGVIQRDFHTVGGGHDDNSHTIVTADGKPRALSKATLVTERYYLADAAFTIAVTTPDPRLLRTCAEALTTPHWPTHLGRRACPPDTPVFLTETTRPLAALTELPLHVAAGEHERYGTRVEFIADHPLDHLPVPAHKHTEAPEHGATPGYALAAEPVSFHPLARAHTAVSYYRRRVRLPRTVPAGLGTAYLTAVTDYLDELRKDHAHA